ncbi:MAG: outer membrane protein assembly factor BamD [Bacteroidales bacterium]|nr:outer membrane protein assembly factor BamD [Bacteroidales bacterium]
MKNRIFLYLLAFLALAACKSQYELIKEGNDVDAKYDLAFKCFNAGKYTKSAELFENMSVLTNGTAREDTVLYYWALSNYRASDYLTAETNFKTFIDKFPRSPFSESAEFLRVDCLYKATYRWELDQMPTYTAVAAIHEYRGAHPGSVHSAACLRMLEDLEWRLDKKAFENAKIYYTMEDYKAARVALRNVLKDDADNQFREDILYYTAMSSYKYADLSVPAKQKERFLVFEDDYFNFIGEYPESKYREELDRLHEKVRKN